MTRNPATSLGAPLGAGAVVALLLGIYASVHEPTGRDFVLTGFESAAAWKSALASVTVVLFTVQVTLGLRMTGRYLPRRPVPHWMPDLHRVVGSVAFGISLPVAFHCLWVLGYRSDDAAILTHSLLGSVAYGLYAAKVVAVHGHRRTAQPEWIVPVLGVVLGTTILAVWWTSALVFWVS